MKILAIDPGTKCGYALSPIESGVWDLSPRRHEGGGMRFFRLRNYLVKTCENVDLVVYEEVRGHRGTDAAQVYGGIVAILTEHCELKEIPYQGVPVGTIKKWATGKGNADKVAMLAAAQGRWPDASIETSDQADAVWLWSWAQNEYSTGGAC